MSAPIRKTILFSLLATFAIGISIWMFSGRASSETGSKNATLPPEVPVAEVLVRKVAPSLEYTGYIAAVESVEVRPRIGGYIQAVTVPEGGIVEQGQILFQVDPRPYQAMLEQSRAQLAQAEARLSQAEAEFARVDQLNDKGIASRDRYDGALANRRERQAQVQAAKSAVFTAELDLSYTRITAPISGRIDRVLVTQGNLVTGGNVGQATLLTTIVSVDPAYVYFDIDEGTYLTSLEKARSDRSGWTGAKLPVRVGLISDQGFPQQGILNFVGNRIDRSTGTIRARASLTNPDGRLAPGLFARVKLITDAPRETVLIDDQAVGTDQGKRYALVLAEGNKVEYRILKLGPVIAGMRSVLSGLAPGEKIIVKGLVRPGMVVTPRDVAMGGNMDAAAFRDAAELAAAE
ncbi:efflux RND transporter periplasmic adaptor subunit [Microvirga sp. Marseille-Q2068]|uniref:Efflux RND transporter periplasmic adaptor subunit n=2 Tax=Microvirga mediterraneensis TaxID=2754695 RepID=A0A838BV48_9HYPH|nr:efflux RND transporter periplasmic adaptor subunit [Microvirga mediterraneensis]